MKLTQLSALFFFLSPIWSSATTHVTRAIILKDAVWDVDTVLINRNLSIPEGSTVWVKDGTQILVAENVNILLAGGAFRCQGGKLGIVLDSQKEGEYWNGFIVKSSNSEAELEFKNTQIHSTQAFYFDSGQPAVLSMDSCQVTNTRAFGIVARKTKLRMTNCHFAGNSGGFIVEGTSLIESSIIENFTELGGLQVSGDSRIVNCLIRNNGNSSSAGGILVSGGDVEIYNCTIVNNKSVKNGGGLSIKSGSASIVNCIIWGNESSLGHQNFYTESAVAVKNCDIDEDLSLFDLETSEDNLQLNPKFVDAYNGNYRLSPSSPARNKGLLEANSLELPLTDLDGNSRIQEDTVDIGAFEIIGIGSSVVARKDHPNIVVYPNPAFQHINVSYRLPESQETGTLQILDNMGREMREIKLQSSLGAVRLNISTLPTGLYLLRLNGVAFQQLIVE